jgi:membrane peptidoglycan carboxypeptidase
VSNAGGGGSGVMSVEDATAGSVNTVYAQMSIDIGPENIVEMAHRMGIESELRPVPSITLGTSEVTPLEIASAYTNFATNGAHAMPYLVSKITDAAGNVIYEHQVEVTQVTDPEKFAAARRPLLRVPISTTPNGREHRSAPGRQDRHPPGLPRRLVRRVRAAVRHRGLGGVRSRPDPAHQRHHQWRPVFAGVRRLGSRPHLP